MNLLQKYLKFKELLSEATSIDHPMIEHNGKMVHKTNSEGQLIHHTDDGIKAFHDWFGDSKTVDDHGRPRVYYHGTTKNFGEFDSNKSSSGAAFGSGIYATEDKSNAAGWAIGEGKHVMPIYIKSHNMLNLRSHMTKHDLDTFSAHDLGPIGKDKEEEYHYHRLLGMEKRYGSISNAANKMGYDSIQHFGPTGNPHILAIDGNQIKSAIGNSGKFSPDSKNINESEDDPIKNFRDKWNSAGVDNFVYGSSGSKTIGSIISQST